MAPSEEGLVPFDSSGLRSRCDLPSETEPKTDQHPDLEKRRKSSAASYLALGLLYTVCIIDGADQQLLPSSYRALEADLGLSPENLAMMSLCQAVAQALSAPFWGSLVDHEFLGPSQILALGAFSWGLLTILLACVSSPLIMVTLRAVNGIALASLSPVVQAVISKLAPEAQRGRYFAWCGFCNCMGQMLCASFGTAVSESRFTQFDIAGWRVAFVIVGLLSVLLAPIVASLLSLPFRDRESQSKLRREEFTSDGSLLEELNMFANFFKVGSFRVIVIQGCFGCMPWSAMVFSTMYLQYAGLSDLVAGNVASIMLLCLACGNIIGGLVGDYLASKSRYHGRPLTAQLSVLISIPTVYIFFKVVPPTVASAPTWFLVAAVFGLCASWCENGVNRPLLSEVVPEHCRGRIVALCSAFQGSIGALGAPTVGLLAERLFGYTTEQRPINQLSAAVRRNNLKALSNGVVLMCIIPWAICFTCYSALHLTYASDMERLKQMTQEQLSDEDEQTALMGSAGVA